MSQMQSDPRAQLRLAHLMLTGRERCTQPDEPIRLVAAACAQRSAEALMYHAALAARKFLGEKVADRFAGFVTGQPVQIQFSLDDPAASP